jgi:hypothetical protein
MYYCKIYILSLWYTTNQPFTTIMGLKLSAALCSAEQSAEYFTGPVNGHFLLKGNYHEDQKPITCRGDLARDDSVRCRRSGRRAESLD